MAVFQPIDIARLRWQGASPYSERYNDIFFDRENGLAEARYVFLVGNDLPQRWLGREQFVIGETGFGTGLNFLATVQAWHDSVSSTARLHYVAVEKHPLSADDVGKAASAWPSLLPWAQALIDVYPQLVCGFHRLHLLDGRVSLTLLLGDAGEMLAQLQARIDAWYLDGFAPSKNASMWSAPIFRQLARLSAPGATFSTFTAAGTVRRGLIQAGFDVAKRAGFGKKREMLHGRLRAIHHSALAQPWFAPAQRPASSLRQAVVVGAGLAGCCVAHALASRGWRVDVVDRHDRVACEASGNPAGVVLPRLTADMNNEGQFYLAAFLYASRWFDRLGEVDDGPGWRRSGVLQLAAPELVAKLTALGLPDAVVAGVDEYGARQRSDVAVRGGGLYFSLGGWLSPPKLCALLVSLHADRINFVQARKVVEPTFRDGLWHIGDGRQAIGAAPVVIFAGGVAAADYADGVFDLQTVRGQITYAAATAASRRLALPVCYDGYVLPELNGRHCVGATFKRDDDARELSEDDDRLNMAALTAHVAAMGLGDVVGGRVAFRAATLDHLPVLGPLSDREYYQTTYAALRHGSVGRHFPNAHYRPGLFVSGGHGARGLISCPLAAETIAAMLDDEPLPLPKDMLASLHPARFLMRRIKRNFS